MQEIHVGINTQRLGDKTAEVFGLQKPNSEELLKHYLYPLLNLGIIDKVRSNIDSRANIYFPVRAGNINVLFSDPDDPRLEVTDPKYYPSKKSLEDTCRTIIEYCSKGGGVNERKYRLVDHDGKDITPEELVDIYLYNPEVCFKEFLSYSGARSKNTAPPLACSNILKEFSNNNKEEYLPAEYENCLEGLNDILTEAWDMSTDSDSDKRERTQALSLAKECYAMKLDLLGSVTVIDRAIKFIDRHRGLTLQNKEVVIKDNDPAEPIENTG